MKKIWNQCVKELAQFRRDRLTVALAFVLPLATLLIFGFAIRLESQNIPLITIPNSAIALGQEFNPPLVAN